MLRTASCSPGPGACWASVGQCGQQPLALLAVLLGLSSCLPGRESGLALGAVSHLHNAVFTRANWSVVSANFFQFRLFLRLRRLPWFDLPCLGQHHCQQEEQGRHRHHLLRPQLLRRTQSGIRSAAYAQVLVELSWLCAVITGLSSCQAQLRYSVSLLARRKAGRAAACVVTLHTSCLVLHCHDMTILSDRFCVNLSLPHLSCCIPDVVFQMFAWALLQD